MVIVFDTGPFTADRSMNKPVSRALLGECEQDRIRVVVPQVVLEEVTAATRGYLRNAQKNVSSAQHNLDETFLTPFALPSLDVDDLVDDYRDEIEQTLIDHKVEIIGWANVSHDEIIERDLGHVPPFDDSGKGYRDALTWHVVRDLVIDDNESVILITRDTDFSASKDEPETLHPTLAEEIGGDSDRVVIVPDIASAVRHVGVSRQNLAASLAVTIEEHNEALGFETVTLLQQLFPYGLDSDDVSAAIHAVQVEDVVEAWGVLTAIVRAELSFEYTGILNAAEHDYYWENDSESDTWVDEVDWNDEQQYATVAGSGYIDVAIEVTAERVDDGYMIDVVGAELLDEPEDE